MDMLLKGMTGKYVSVSFFLLSAFILCFSFLPIGSLVLYDHLLQVIVLARKKKKNKKGQSNCITHTIFRRQNIFLAEGAQIASREGVKTQENEFKPLLVVF